MKKTIFPYDEKRKCFLCGKHCYTERHHVFGGPWRKKSEDYNITVHLCHECHNEPPHGAHYNRAVSDYLKRIGQKAAMKEYGWTIDEFRQHFGKNYLE